MNIGRCPVCHSHIQLEAVVQDEAMSKLIGILAGMDGQLSRPLVSYLGLFRPAKRDLANDRALRLCLEVIDLTSSRDHLAAAVSQTVEMIRAKGGGPLKNHNYLKRVLENIDSTPCMLVQKKQQTGTSKSEQALMNIESVKDRYE